MYVHSTRAFLCIYLYDTFLQGTGDKQNFYTKKIPLKGVSIDGKGWPLYYQKFKVGDLEWSTSDFSQGKQWLFYLKNSAIGM